MNLLSNVLTSKNGQNLDFSASARVLKSDVP